ncbi:MAG: hypothetical protein DME65_13980 [Verrucomicrobia bacterium]|nr:MAG: hypothetical protein DME65_13980 [Verrucomicrobiota bacterium]
MVWASRLPSTISQLAGHGDSVQSAQRMAGVSTAKTAVLDVVGVLRGGNEQEQKHRLRCTASTLYPLTRRKSFGSIPA